MHVRKFKRIQMKGETCRVKGKIEVETGNDSMMNHG